MRLYPNPTKRYGDGCPVCGSLEGECTTEWSNPTNIQARQTCYACGTQTGTQLLPQEATEPYWGGADPVLIDELLKIGPPIWNRQNPLLTLLMGEPCHA